MSNSDELTEKSLAQLERKLKKEYRKAYEGMKARYDEYINGSDEMDGSQVIHHQSLAERLAKEEEAYKQGKYTDAEWKAYVQTHIQRGERYEAMADELANRMTNANLVAEAYINDKTPGIYSLNANYQAYEIGKGLQGISFTMYDEQTVKNLILGNGNFTEFRTVKINPVRDYEWNSKQINSALTSAILQGKTIDKLADSFMAVMKRNRSSAIRNARTAVTSAQNGGRITSLRQAKAQGIEVRKQWLSAHDGRVRDSHAMLNGQIRDIEDEFDNGLMYPGDSNGIPSEVYNCRCTLTYIYPEFDDDESSEIYKDEALEGETYQQFVKRMRKAEDKSIIESNKMRYANITVSAYKTGEASKAGDLRHPKLSREERKAVIARGVSSSRACFVEDTERNKLASLSKLLPPEKNKYDVVLHGASDYMEFYGQPIDAETLAEILLQRKDYKKGTNIRLLSCSTGLEDADGNCVAQELANKLGVTVFAPDDILFLIPDGGAMKIRVGTMGDGSMKPFVPIYR